MIDTFTNTFGLPENSVKLAGGVEAAAAGLFAASFLNKNISRLGSLAAISVLGVAAYKHFEAGRVSSRIGMKRLLTIALTTCIVSIILMGVTTNIILITTFSVLFVAGIAFAIPTVISKIGVVVKNNQGFFLSVNTFVLFLGTAIAPILMLFVGELSNFFLQFLMIAIVGLIALVVSIFMPGDQRS